MSISRPIVAVFLAASMTLPAMAQPIEIATLGRAPLMGQSTNAAELQNNVRHNEALLHRAGMSLGLTNEQYQQFRLALEVGRPNWVTIPRHLDAMTWASDGRIHVLHDVIIPANQKGVEVDLQSGDRMISIFLPARCGNLSVIRRTVPRVAAVRNFPVPHPPRYVAVQPTPVCPEGTTGTYPNCASPPAPVVAAAPPPPIPVGAPSHGLNLLPLAAILPFIVHTGSSSTPGGGGGIVVGPPPCP